jgi:hypothetical protein
MAAEISLTAAIKEAAGKLIDQKSESERGLYARTVYLAFEEIGRLKDARISLAEICGAFERAGLLQENASPHSFRDAYRREKARRAKLKGGLNDGDEGFSSRAYKSAIAAAKKTEPPQTELPDESDETERLKELTGVWVDTGCGDILKLPNGSFDF